MDRYVIVGGNRLCGIIENEGSKNAALPIIAASLLADRVILHNMPALEDINVLCGLASHIGADIRQDGDIVDIKTHGINKCSLPKGMAAQIRYSILLLAVLLHRFGKGCTGLPGGDKIGERKIDAHLTALRALGSRVEVNDSHILVEARKLLGAKFKLDFPSVTGTEIALIASCLARGKSIITNVAKEPEVVDLADFLNRVGGKIKGAGTDIIVVEGVKALDSGEFTVIPDRINAVTYMIAAAITGGDVIVRHVNQEHLGAPIQKLRQIGVKIDSGEGEIRVTADQLLPVDISTEVYPGFPTDLQPLFSSLLTLARGQSKITENIYENRFHHAHELNKMGANISPNGRHLVINGVNRLNGIVTSVNDIRCGGALVLAGLAAEGATVLNNVYQIDRGYVSLEDKLSGVGADIKRIEFSRTAEKVLVGPREAQSAKEYLPQFDRDNGLPVVSQGWA
jgi:UDP-N-acetylglucosamine 1-carboxyvinyltransferase